MPCVYFSQTVPEDTSGWYGEQRGEVVEKARQCGLMVEASDLEAVDTGQWAQDQPLTHSG